MKGDFNENTYNFYRGHSCTFIWNNHSPNNGNKENNQSKARDKTDETA